MTTCREIISLGLQLSGVISLGRQPTDKEADTGMMVLQGMYDGMANDGLFCRYTDVYTTDDYTANEGERITANNAAITIPPTIMEDGVERPIKDLASVIVISGGNQANFVYSGGAWETMSALELESPAPLATRGKDGLASMFAMYFADAFGTGISPIQRNRALNFNRTLLSKFGTEREAVEYY